MFLQAHKSTKQYHTQLYKSAGLFKKGTWLEKTEPDILDIGKKLSSRHPIHILDLGSGVGRNAIPLARALQKNGVSITCIDYLPIAIEKLHEYATMYHVETNIVGAVSSVEDFAIEKNSYDCIVSHGVLAHVRGKQILYRVIKDIAGGVKEGGYVYLSIASDLKESEMKTKEKIKPLIEVSLSSSEVKKIYIRYFKGWTFEVLRIDPYVEYYEQEGKNIVWKCNFVTLIAKKP